MYDTTKFTTGKTQSYIAIFYRTGGTKRDQNFSWPTGAHDTERPTGAHDTIDYKHTIIYDDTEPG